MLSCSEPRASRGIRAPGACGARAFKGAPHLVQAKGGHAAPKDAEPKQHNRGGVPGCKAKEPREELGR